MKPEKTYCTLDLFECDIVEIFSTKSAAEKFTAKRIRQWHSTLNILIRSKKPSRFYTMTLNNAIEEIKYRVKDQTQLDRY